MLIVHSGLVPRVIDLMIVAGACYSVNSLVAVLAPALSQLIVPRILLACLVGELPLELGLVVKGVNAEAPQIR